MKILNFGALNIDYVYTVDHILSEGETLSSKNLEIFPGGKGLNQSVALAKAGADVYHAGKIGVEGKILKDTLASYGVKLDYVKESSDKSGHAIIQVDKSGRNNILLYGGANKTISKDFVDEVLKDFSKEDIILLQNEISEVAYIINEAYKKDMTIVFNPSPIDEDILRLPLEKVHCFILNEIEGMCLTGNKEKIDVSDNLLEKYPHAQIILTLGEKGVIYRDKLNTYQQAAFRVKAVDTTAAGDTFTGYYLASVVGGLNVSESLKRASKAAALAVSKKGASTSIPTLEEVEKSQ